jgi:glycosyltransferase involved in cell wall biosynthesis
MPKLDVLMCVHSRDPYHDSLAKAALHSLHKQTYRDFKVIVVLDECWPKTRRYLDHRFRPAPQMDRVDVPVEIYERPKKEGLAAAKNFGLQFCKSDYVAYQDADDTSIACRLELQMQYMTSFYTDTDFCFTEAWDVDSKGVWRPNCFDVGKYQTDEDIKDALPGENVLCHGSAMIRRKALEILGGYSEDKRWLGQEDYHLWTRAAQMGFKFYKVPERLYVYSLGTSVER